MGCSKSERWTDNTMANKEQSIGEDREHNGLICLCIVFPSLWFTAAHLPLYCLSISMIYCSSFAIVLSVHLYDLLLLICHCIVCPSLRFTASHLSFVILSVHLSDFLLLICHCIVCPSLRFTAPHLSLYCLSISLIHCSSFVIILSVHLSDLLLLICHCIVCPSLLFIAPHLSLYFDKWGIVNRRDGQTIQWQMRSGKSERWTDNTMTNEEQ
jgi:hypothetical protein